jgi:hypothetical protein
MIFGEEGSITRAKLDRIASIPMISGTVEVSVTSTRVAVLVGKGKEVPACSDGVEEFFGMVMLNVQAKEAIISNEIDKKKDSFRFLGLPACIFISMLFLLTELFGS